MKKRRKKRRKEGWKEGRKVRGKEGRKVGRKGRVCVPASGSHPAPSIACNTDKADAADGYVR